MRQIRIFSILVLSSVVLFSYADDVSGASYVPMLVAPGDCSVNSAFNQGLTDGMSSYTMMQYNYAASINCTTNQVALNDAYKQGFLTGLPHRPKQEHTVVEHYPDGDTQTYSN